ncbi:helix-turn-helix domain-containing protein [Nocardioides sp. MAHUQ-72]|uniref:helix-turn-helix domain-containing protein n=1 Tax=unclassified Nocardioides TaxID=2615069 RepID=UPI00360D255B
MSHGSARLTVQGRLLIVQLHQQGWKKAHIAAAMGGVTKSVRTWIDRYGAEGEAGLRDRSSRPHSTPTRTSAEVEQRVVEVRRTERRGRHRIGDELGIPPRTVSRNLARHQMPRLAESDPMTGELIRASRATTHCTRRAVRASWCTWTSRN